MTPPALVVGVDVGGTKVLAGAVSDTGQVLRRVQGSTPPWPVTRSDGHRLDRESVVAAVEDAVVDAVRAVADGERPVAVGLAAAGFVDAAGERVRFAPHLPWRGEPVRTRLEERLQAPVVVDNDATCAAYAEWSLGAARGHDSALVITLGTGIGGGIVVGGRIHRGRGMAGEFGHMQVVPDGAPCECGGSGCWEQYCSGNALVRFARSRMGSEPSMVGELCQGDPAALTGPMVTQAAESGDLLARQAYLAVGDWLGVGVANLVAAFDPEVVVIGGGVSAAGDRLLAPARASLVRSLVGADWRDLPAIRLAALGPSAGMVGAAALARAATPTCG